jgi:hypothetical protein
MPKIEACQRQGRALRGPFAFGVAIILPQLWARVAGNKKS